MSSTFVTFLRKLLLCYYQIKSDVKTVVQKQNTIWIKSPSKDFSPFILLALRIEYRAMLPNVNAVKGAVAECVSGM